jgi:hypothetical protein
MGTRSVLLSPDLLRRASTRCADTVACFLPERGGFEPPVPLRVQRLSRAPDSATLAPLPSSTPGTDSPTQTKKGQLGPLARDVEGQGIVIGEGGIRTPGTASGSTVFKTASFDHSDTSPKRMEADASGRWVAPVCMATFTLYWQCPLY